MFACSSSYFIFCFRNLDFHWTKDLILIEWLIMSCQDPGIWNRRRYSNMPEWGLIQLLLCCSMYDHSEERTRIYLRLTKMRKRVFSRQKKEKMKNNSNFKSSENKLVLQDWSVRINIYPHFYGILSQKMIWNSQSLKLQISEDSKDICCLAERVSSLLQCSHHSWSTSRKKRAAGQEIPRFCCGGERLRPAAKARKMRNFCERIWRPDSQTFQNWSKARTAQLQNRFLKEIVQKMIMTF